MMQRAWEQALSYLMEHDPDAAREAYAELLDLRGCHEVAALVRAHALLARALRAMMTGEVP
jgi:hypothetical protein